MSCLALPTPRIDTTRAVAGAAHDGLDDASLVSEMIADVPGAWRVFYQRYGRLVWRSLARVVRRFWSRTTSADLQDVQSAFYLSLLANDKRKLRAFDPTRGHPLATWIRALALNAAYDFARRLHREPTTEALSVAFDVPAGGPDPHTKMVLRERVGAVGRALSGFTERDRLFVELHLIEGLTPTRVAQEMGVSVKTVYSRKNKIVTRLRDLSVAG
jgi:RNA polymerase sigma-70 factor, ECF subfamily